jgi:hypothetical protein
MVGSDEVGSLIRRAFERVVGFNHSKRRHRTFAALLEDHVGKFMGEQPQALSRSGVVASPAEDYVRADRIGPRTQGPCGCGREFVSVQAHAAEVVAEAGLHKGAEGRIKRRP